LLEEPTRGSMDDSAADKIVVEENFGVKELAKSQSEKNMLQENEAPNSPLKKLNATGLK